MSATLAPLIVTVRRSLDHYSYFTFTTASRIPQVVEKSMNAEEAFVNIRKLNSFTIDLLRSKNLRQISFEERETVRGLVDCVYRCSKAFTKQFSKTCPDKARILQIEALNAKLGGRICGTLLGHAAYKDFVSFIQANALQHKVQALGQQLDLIPSLPIEGFDRPVSWTQITKQALVQSKPSDPVFAFYYQGRELFRTDSKLKLHTDYTYIDGKIAKYNPIDSPEVRAYDKEPAAPGRYKIELWTAIDDPTGQRPVIALGDHAYLVLVDEEGNRFGVGQYGMADEFDWNHVFSAFGRKKGGIETPDRYLLLAKDSHSFQKTDIMIDKAAFERIMTRIQKKKTDPNFSVSLLCGNCSTSVESLLSIVEVKVNNKVTVIELFFRKFAPLTLIAFVDRITAALPSLVKKGLFFLPIFHIPMIMYGLFTRALSLKNFNNEPSDISLWNVFFRPWKVTIDHPFAIRRWQQAHAQTINLTN